MTKAQYTEICESLSTVHNAIMRKEMSDDGWDLRDELLALKEAVADLAMIVYQTHPPTVELRPERPYGGGPPTNPPKGDKPRGYA